MNDSIYILKIVIEKNKMLSKQMQIDRFTNSNVL